MTCEHAIQKSRVRKRFSLVLYAPKCSQVYQCVRKTLIFLFILSAPRFLSVSDPPLHPLHLAAAGHRSEQSGARATSSL